MAAKKGQAKAGGRAKGTPNRLTSDVKKMILEALDEAGGYKYLYNQALANPGPFMTLIGKVLPLQISGSTEQPLEINHTLTLQGLSVEQLEALAKGSKK